MASPTMTAGVTFGVRCCAQQTLRQAASENAFTQPCGSGQQQGVWQSPGSSALLELPPVRLMPGQSCIVYQRRVTQYSFNRLMRS